VNARILLFVAALGFPSIAAGQTVTITSLTDLGAGVQPNAINSYGVVVGQDAAGQAFAWQNGAMTELPTLGGSGGAANAINDSGEVVGWSYWLPGSPHAFSWTSAGGIVDLSSGMVESTTAQSVNKYGVVAGWWQDLTPGTISVYWTSAGANFPFSHANSEALGINDQGEIVGVQLDASGNPCGGYYWNGTGYTWTASFTSFRPLAGINNNGVAAGQAGGVGAYWSVAGGLVSTGKLSASDSSSVVEGLNDGTHLVGQSGGKAFLFDTASQQMYNLSSLLPAGSLFASLDNATGINNSDEFIGVGEINGVEHGFVGQITSTPEPPTLALLAAAACLCTVFARRGQRAGPRRGADAAC
jgi:probable HAF family extracellular repeat protein